MPNERNTASGSTNWFAVTEEAGKNEIIYNNFRKIDIVKEVVDGFPKYAAVDYLLTLKKEYDYPSFIDIWESNDKFMSPDTFILYKGKKLTPATGRQVVNVNNYINFFGREILNGSICEIGAGWGGRW